MSGSSTVWVPVHIESLGLRKPAARTEITHCREILIARAVPLVDEARSRHANLASRLKQGTITTFCEVVRDLYAFGEHKSLYGTIAGFYKVTKDVLCQEWAIVEEITYLDAVQEIDALLTRGRENINAATA